MHIAWTRTANDANLKSPTVCDRKGAERQRDQNTLVQSTQQVAIPLTSILHWGGGSDDSLIFALPHLAICSFQPLRKRQLKSVDSLHWQTQWAV